MAGLGAMALAGWLWRHPAATSSSAPGRNATNQTALATLTVVAPASNSLLNIMPGKVSTLAELQAALASVPENEKVATIRRLLDSKVDAATGLGFKISKDGALAEAPTLRAWLLDELARLDPAAAADYAKIILQAKTSPDEWALALRNLARGDASAAARALLAEKTGELLAAKDWQQNPAVSYLEAFDTAVFLGGTNFVPTLAALVGGKDNPAVAHAAFLSLDRLVLNDAPATLSVLLAESELLAGREEMRADYFARADASNPQQRALLENYLLDAHTGTSELTAFEGVFPNGNFMISANLLTQSPALDQGEIRRRDAASLAVVQAWLLDPRFVGIKPHLEKVQARLQEFVRQANGQ